MTEFARVVLLGNPLAADAFELLLQEQGLSVTIYGGEEDQSGVVPLVQYVFEIVGGPTSTMTGTRAAMDRLRERFTGIGIDIEPGDFDDR